MSLKIRVDWLLLDFAEQNDRDRLAQGFMTKEKFLYNNVIRQAAREVIRLRASRENSDE